MEKTDKAVMTSRQAAELDFSFQRNGWTAKDIKELSKGDVLALVLEVVRGQAEIKLMIDCDADPFVPDGFKVKDHNSGRRIQWDPMKVIIYQERDQKYNQFVYGHDLYLKLRGMHTLNANVLEYLLMHQKFIPKDWSGKRIFFWDTIYESCGYSYVRFMEQSGVEWISGVYAMESNFGHEKFYSALYVDESIIAVE